MLTVKDATHCNHFATLKWPKIVNFDPQVAFQSGPLLNNSVKCNYKYHLQFKLHVTLIIRWLVNGKSSKPLKMGNFYFEFGVELEILIESLIISYGLY